MVNVRLRWVRSALVMVVVLACAAGGAGRRVRSVEVRLERSPIPAATTGGRVLRPAVAIEPEVCSTL